MLNYKYFVLLGSLVIFGLTLFTNQYFHSGVFGTLHNKSVKPKIEISNIEMNQSQIKFEIYRTEGADVYGSFLIGIDLLNEKGKVIQSLNGKELSKFSKENIHNHYVAKVKPGKHSLIIPLGAKADLSLVINEVLIQNEKISIIKLTDISGAEWTAKIE